MSLPPRPTLPLRDGVGASCVVVAPGAWPHVLAFLTARFPAQDAAIWQARLQGGDVLDDDGHAVAADAPCSHGQRLHYYRHVPDEPRIPFDEVVLHHDDDLLVVDKPHFLPVQPGGDYLQETLLVRLRRRLGIDALAPLHRLDRETAGIVLFSTRVATRDAYSALFRDRKIHKTYEAVAAWNPALPWPLEHRSRLVPAAHFMQQHEVPGTPNTLTRIAPLAVQSDSALYALQPATGHRHQLRVHMAALGLPIEGDTLYPQLQPEGSTDYTRPLQLLARGLVFEDPVRGGLREFRSARTLRVST